MPAAQQRQRGRDRTEDPNPLLMRGASAQGVGHIIDVSDTGVQFRSSAEIAPGSEVSLRIPRAEADRPPLIISAFVVRCLRAETGSGDAYAVACAYD